MRDFLDLFPPPDNTILSAVVGSTAYGLANANSDVDMLGVFVANTRDILSLNKPNPTITSVDPDLCYHEVERFISLCLKVNPTVTELLYLDEYEILTEPGQMLIANRSAFLSHSYVRNAYLGYATQQLKRLLQRGDSFSSKTKNRTAKHARHCTRLLMQGMELMQTGTLTVKLDANKAVICTAYGELAQEDPLAFKTEFELLEDEFLATVEDSVLPLKPDITIANEILLRIRQANW